MGISTGCSFRAVLRQGTKSFRPQALNSLLSELTKSKLRLFEGSNFDLAILAIRVPLRTPFPPLPPLDGVFAVFSDIKIAFPPKLRVQPNGYAEKRTLTLDRVVTLHGSFFPARVLFPRFGNSPRTFGQRCGKLP